MQRSRVQLSPEAFILKFNVRSHLCVISDSFLKKLLLRKSCFSEVKKMDIHNYEKKYHQSKAGVQKAALSERNKELMNILLKDADVQKLLMEKMANLSA